MPTGQPDTRTAATAEVPAALAAATGVADLAAAVVATMHIDAARCRAALDDSAAAATDVASILVRDHGIDFRTAHEIAARLVGDLRADGRRLADASSADVATAAAALGAQVDLSPASLQDALDPRRAVAGRVGPGGAAPGAIEAMIAGPRGALSEADAWVARRLARIDGAERALADRAASLAASA
jgi:argininosuccinate lyase